uniref:Mixed lineage kinase domain like pseudokinase n=1 Tax=Chinchilla lanigera TaxID=34839 RepID=A0A8C2V2K4_CHILA
MDYLGKIFSIVQKMREQCKKMKYCQNQSLRLQERVSGLHQALQSLGDKGMKYLSPEITAALNDFENALKKAMDELENYNTQSNIRKFAVADGDKILFKEVNQKLEDVWELLMLQLQIAQYSASTSRGESWAQEDQSDADKDRQLQALQSLNIKDTLKECKPVQKTAQEQIKEIKEEELSGSPWTLLKKSEFSELYKGEYHRSPVAIKVFSKAQVKSTGIVREHFRKEISDMRTFDSPSILRIFGICIMERGSAPRFCLVSEYCERGSLRDVLDEDKNLRLGVRWLLAQGAATGLYRYRNLPASVFLSLIHLPVQLTGFELRETQTSISQKIKGNKTAYSSPQRLESPFHKYDIKAEIYSFGIVLWEIATGKIPFEGCNSKEIYQLVFEKQQQEPLGEDCCPLLQEIIDECRAYEPSARPSVSLFVCSFTEILRRLSAFTEQHVKA